MVSIVAISFYIVYDILVGNYSQKLYSGFLGLFIFIGCWVFTIKHKDIKQVVFINSIVFIISISASFFTMDGMRGVFPLDLINLYLYVGLITTGRTRNVSIGLCLLITFVCFYLQSQQSHLIFNIREGDPLLVTMFFMFLRFLMTLSLGLTVKEEYEKEKRIISILNNDLTAKNKEIQRINNELEFSVKFRTNEVISQNQKMIDFAFYNSENTTGPLARLLGLVYVLKLVKPEDKGWDSYKEKLVHSNIELDNMVDKIDVILKEGLSRSQQKKAV
jgi:hypothetical protein